MENINYTIKIDFELDELKKGNKFSIEKKHAYYVLNYKYQTFLNYIINGAMEKDYNKYINSLAYKLKNMYESNSKSLTEKEYNKIKNSIITVPVKITKRKSGKIKYENLKMLPDKTLEFFASKKSLQTYLTCLNKYKKIRDEGKKEFFIFDYGKEYSTKEEFRNIKMLILTTQIANTLIQKENATEQDEQLAINWNKFLKENVEISYTYLDYDYLDISIESLPQFNKDTLNFINNQNKKLTTALSNLNKQNANEDETDLTL